MIAAELAEMGLTPPPETEAVVRRVIHTTADFDYAKNLRFTPGAVQKAVEALHKGAFIVTDTNMALAGISKPGLRVYAKSEELPKVLGGLGIAIISTSKGLMTDKEARKQMIGGEVLAYIW